MRPILHDSGRVPGYNVSNRRESLVSSGKKNLQRMKLGLRDVEKARLSRSDDGDDASVSLSNLLVMETLSSHYIREACDLQRHHPRLCPCNLNLRLACFLSFSQPISPNSLLSFSFSRQSYMLWWRVPRQNYSAVQQHGVHVLGLNATPQV